MIRNNEEALREIRTRIEQQRKEVMRPAEAAGNPYALNAPRPTWAIRADEPALLITKPMSDAAKSDWREDLRVMDKIIDDAIAGAALDVGAVQAMGIYVVNVKGGTAVAPAPLYLEGIGVVLSATVDFPIATTRGSTATSQPGATHAPISPWEQARRQVKGIPPAVNHGMIVQRTFDAARLERLIDALMLALREASNFRHLQADETVFITVAGSADDGSPRRLTLKARKDQIDAAAAGNLEPAAFRREVSLLIEP